MTNVYIIEKWYKKLEFPQKYDEEFYRALHKISVPMSATIDSYTFSDEASIDNLLAILYLCEEVSLRYKELNIPEDILVATLKDIVVWTNTYTVTNNRLCLGECFWLESHLNLQIFRIGRLQYRIGQSVHNVPEYNYVEGVDVLEIHIPEDGKLDIEDCKKSIASAKEFFAKYFPHYTYKYMTCNAWLLDTNLKKYLDKESNILRFADMFEVIYEFEADDILKRIFPWDTNRENLHEKIPTTSLARRVKEGVLKGDVFHVSLGVLKQ